MGLDDEAKALEIGGAKKHIVGVGQKVGYVWAIVAVVA